MQADEESILILRLKSVKLLFWLFFVSGLALGPTGCSTSKPGKADSADSAHANHAALELNAGKKWVVAPPMMAHLRHLEQAVDDFDRTPGRNHALLATDIQDTLGRLVTNCTMEGKAHDELHKWLMPFLGLSADYTRATNPQVQEHKLHQIKQALVVFNEYLE